MRRRRGGARRDSWHGRDIDRRRVESGKRRRKRKGVSWFPRNAEMRGGGEEEEGLGYWEAGKEECSRRGGQRGTQQVECTSVTFCSSRLRMPRRNRGGGGRGAQGERGRNATSKRSITKQAYIYTILKLNSRHF